MVLVWFVCLSVNVSPAKTPKPIKILFSGLTHVVMWTVKVGQIHSAPLGVLSWQFGHTGELHKKWLNRSRCHFGADVCESKERCIRWGQGWTNPFAAMRVDKMAVRPFIRIL